MTSRFLGSFCILVYSNLVLGQNPDNSFILDNYQKLIGINSTSGRENEATRFLLTKSTEMGFYIKRYADNDSFLNFSASVYPLSQNKPNIVFLSHTDVVPAPDSLQWKYPPFSGKLQNDTIWGRGCLDMKGMGLMELYAMRSFLNKPDLPYNLTILFVADEEKGGTHGSQFICKNYLKELNPILVIGEGGAGLQNMLPSKPGQLVFSVSVAEKESMWLKLSVKHHTGGHGAMASPETANGILLRALGHIEEKKPVLIFDKTTRHMFRQLGKLNGGFKGFIIGHISSFWLYPFRRLILKKEPLLLNEVINTTQLTSIYNNSASPNVIPTDVYAYLDCRLLPGVKHKKFIRRLRLKILNPKVKIEIIDQSPEAMASPIGKQYYNIEKALLKAYPGCKVLPVLFPATSDNSFFRAEGINSYGILPVQLSTDLIKTVHGANERIPVKTIFKGIEGYRQIMQSLEDN